MADTPTILPSPRRAIALTLVLLAIVLIGYGARRAGEQAEPEGFLYVAGSDERIALSDADADGDSLLDWEELLWETDSGNPDTDGDGTPDGEEVSAGRNPSIPGPGDTFVFSSAVASSGQRATSSEEATQTERFGEAFITTYLNSKVVGGSFTAQSDLFSALAIPALPPIPAPLSSELRTAPVSERSVHDYGNAIGAILKRNAPGTENELIVMLTALRDDDPSRLAALERTVVAYERNAADLLAVSVPEDRVSGHLALVYAFSLVARDIETMARFYDDPLTGLAGIESYFATSEQLTASLDALRAYLTRLTSFAPHEDGYVITGGL